MQEKIQFQKNQSELILIPDTKNLSQVADYLRGELAAHGVPEKTKKKLLIAFDEMYTNVVCYSGAQIAEIRCSFEECMLVVLLRDNGEPYNPLEAGEPDTAAPAAERKIGGLGIYMARKMADRLEYRYVDGCNEVTIAVRY